MEPMEETTRETMRVKKIKEKMMTIGKTKEEKTREEKRRRRRKMSTVKIETVSRTNK
jgi:hypothetical protein